MGTRYNRNLFLTEPRANQYFSRSLTGYEDCKLQQQITTCQHVVPRKIHASKSIAISQLHYITFVLVVPIVNKQKMVRNLESFVFWSLKGAGQSFVISRIPQLRFVCCCVRSSHVPRGMSSLGPCKCTSGIILLTVFWWNWWQVICLTKQISNWNQRTLFRHLKTF